MQWWEFANRSCVENNDVIERHDPRACGSDRPRDVIPGRANAMPPDDGWGDLGDAPPLPDEGQELPGLPDDDILGDMFGAHLADADWLERNLADIVVEDSSDCALIPVLPADDVVGMDICEVCDAVALPDSLARPT